MPDTLTDLFFSKKNNEYYVKIYVKKNAVEGGWGVFKASKHVLKMALKQGGRI